MVSTTNLKTWLTKYFFLNVATWIKKTDVFFVKFIDKKNHFIN